MSYYPTETISRYVYFKDKDDTPIDPDTKEAKVYDPDGNFKTDVALTPIIVGKYQFNYALPADAVKGAWYIIIKGTKGSYVEIERIFFEVLGA